jgi:uncharacterized repeat protein (TIGR03803 family)
MNPCVLARRVSFLLVLAAATIGAAHSQTYSVLYNFGTLPNRPWGPNEAGMIAQGRTGYMYSTGGGGGAYNDGAAYSISTAGGLTVWHSFNGSDGDFPSAGLTMAADGTFFGTTADGGVCANGTIYRLGATGAYLTLYQFSCTDGFASAPPTQAMDGYFYGATVEGGTLGYGEIYRISPTGQFSVMYQSDGTIYKVFAPLVVGNDGALYGVSNAGGDLDHGAFFKITTSGQFTLLYSFDHVNGGSPESLYQAADGNFYGVAGGGSANSGVVFKITTAGAYTVLHEMNGTSDGQYPVSQMIQASDGNFYGGTTQGGAISSTCPSGCGTIFKITPQGAYSVLHTFAHTDGDSLWSALYQHTNGLIYGATRYGGTGTDSTCYANCGVFFSLNAGLTPYAALSPFFGSRGTSFTILGQGFTAATKVTIGGTSVSFTIVSDTCITATVPTFASSGRVTVYSGRGSLMSNRNFIIR